MMKESLENNNSQQQQRKTAGSSEGKDESSSSSSSDSDDEEDSNKRKAGPDDDKKEGEMAVGWKEKPKPTLLSQKEELEESMNDEILMYLRQPKKVRFGALKILLTIVSGIYAGAFLAKFGANLLEEYEIFVKEDDDDD